MKYTTQKLEVSRGIVKEQEARIVLQRRKVEKAVTELYHADQAQARLMVMDQSLLAMKRFLHILEGDLDAELSLHRHQTHERIKVQKQPVPTPGEEVEQLADDFASRATAAVLMADDLYQLETLARAMRSSTRR